MAPKQLHHGSLRQFFLQAFRHLTLSCVTKTKATNSRLEQVPGDCLLLTEIPRELRDQIYEYVFFEEKGFTIQHHCVWKCAGAHLSERQYIKCKRITGPVESALLYTCHQVRAEALQVAFKVNEMHCTGAFAFYDIAGTSWTGTTARTTLTLKSFDDFHKRVDVKSSYDFIDRPAVWAMGSVIAFWPLVATKAALLHPPLRSFSSLRRLHLTYPAYFCSRLAYLGSALQLCYDVEGRGLSRRARIQFPHLTEVAWGYTWLKPIYQERTPELVDDVKMLLSQNAQLRICIDLQFNTDFTEEAKWPEEEGYLELLRLLFSRFILLFRDPNSNRLSFVGSGTTEERIPLLDKDLLERDGVCATCKTKFTSRHKYALATRCMLSMLCNACSKISELSRLNEIWHLEEEPEME